MVGFYIRALLRYLIRLVFGKSQGDHISKWVCSNSQDSSTLELFRPQYSNIRSSNRPDIPDVPAPVDRVLGRSELDRYCNKQVVELDCCNSYLQQ